MISSLFFIIFIVILLCGFHSDFRFDYVKILFVPFLFCDLICLLESFLYFCLPSNYYGISKLVILCCYLDVSLF